MRPITRAREFQEGWTGRRRNYRCLVCAQKFQHDGFRLPEKARICIPCRMDPVNFARFDKAMEVRNGH